MPDSKLSQTERRAQTINSLRVNASQATSWQTRFVDLLEEIHRDNVALRNGYSLLVQRVESLERERITA